VKFRDVAFAASVLVALAALGLPWLDRHLSNDLYPSSSALVFLRDWKTSDLNWATVAAFMVLLCLLSRLSNSAVLRATFVHRVIGKRGRTLAWGVVLMPMLFLLHQRYAGSATMESLLNDQAGYLAFGHQLQYTIGTSPLVSFLGLPLSPQWSLVLNAVGAGVPTFEIAGIAILLSTPARPARYGDRTTRESGQRAATWAAVTVALAVLVYGCPVVASFYTSAANRHASLGDYTSASADLKDALNLDPAVVSDNRWVTDMAQVSYAAGGPSSAVGIFWAAQVYANAGYTLQQLESLRAAHQLDPHNVVLANDLVLASVQLAAGGLDPTPLTALPTALQRDDLVQYTLARLRFRVQDYTDARPTFLAVASSARSGDMRSSAWTYLAFIDDAAGHPLVARADVEAALRFDPDHSNTQAAAYAAGLYELSR
jgi:hypothetical protein